MKKELATGLLLLMSLPAFAGGSVVFASPEIDNYISLMNATELCYDFAAKQIIATDLKKPKLGDALTIVLLASEADPELCKVTFNRIAAAFGNMGTGFVNLTEGSKALAANCGKSLATLN